MSRVLLVVIAALALAGAALWFATDSGFDRGSRSAEGTAPTKALEPDSPALERAPAATWEGERRASEGTATPPREIAIESWSEPPSIQEAELARAQWVDGRVLFPAGTPEDEEVFVVADGWSFFENFRDHRVKVERDGSFRVAFGEKTRTGEFELVARYLYLEEKVRWKSTEPSIPVVLEPKLGARIAGRVRPPIGSNSRPVVGRVELDLFEGNSNRQRRRDYGLSGLGFVFDSLVPGKGQGLSYEVSFEGESFIGQSTKLVPEAGKTLEVELELRPGVTLAGVVRDESGAPLEDVGIRAEVATRAPSCASARFRSAQSAEDGKFRMPALAEGRIRLEARHEGYETLVRELGRLEKGASIEDLELVLSRGGSIAGTVRWPDGSPAPATLVIVPSPKASGSATTEERRIVTDERGDFSISGLSRESYRVTARTRRSGPNDGPVGRQYVAEVETVRTGTADLVLTLSRGLTVAGLVVDDLGARLPDFSLDVGRFDHGHDMVDWEGELTSSYRDSDGSFLLEGFTPGDWSLRARSPGHSPSEIVRVTLPSNAPVELRVPRAASVSGVVLDPAGAPVAGAVVELVRDSRSPRDDVEQTSRRTDESGAFHLESLEPGAVKLTASRPGSVHGASIEVELVAGEDIAGVELLIGTDTGGVLEGLVRFPDGVSGRTERLWAYAQGDMGTEPIRCDPSGRFWIRLASGSYLVGVGSGDGWACEPARVEITSGQTRAIVLELQRATPVLVTVRKDGIPVGCELQVLDTRGKRQRVQNGLKGTVWAGPLLPGRYTARALRDGVTVERGFEVRADEKEPKVEIVFE